MAATRPPSLADIATLVHRATTDDPVAQLVYVEDHGPEDLHVGRWDIPSVLEHPVDPVVGFRAPARWDAVGLVSSGRLRALDADPVEPTHVLTTVLAHRNGRVASLVAAPHEVPRVIDDRPAGWIPDVLARILAIETPPPDRGIGSFTDLTWLDRIACGVLQRPSRGRSWRWLADRHPLRGGGPPPSPGELAARTAREAADHSWSTLRTRMRGLPLPAARYGPPGGTVLDADEWFDDGSLCRWLLRQLPPAEALLPDLLAVLPPDLGMDLLMGLAEVDAPAA